MGCFQQEAAKFASREIERMLAEGDRLGFIARIIDAVKSAADNVDVDVDADSQFRVESDFSEVNFTEVDIGTVRFEPVDFGKDYLVAQIQVPATAEIISHFEFSKLDPIISH